MAHVTPVLKLPVPVTAAANCTCVPMVAVVGVTVMDVIVGPVGAIGCVGVFPPPPQAASVSASALAISTAACEFPFFIE
jgi:hypothetical protein